MLKELPSIVDGAEPGKPLSSFRDAAAFLSSSAYRVSGLRPKINPVEKYRERVMTVEEGWARPSERLIEEGETLLRDLHEYALKRGLRWREPVAVGNGPDGQIILEWRSDEKCLIIELHEEERFLIKSWGPSIQEDMEDHYFERSEQVFPFINWVLWKRTA